MCIRQMKIDLFLKMFVKVQDCRVVCFVKGLSTRGWKMLAKHLSNFSSNPIGAFFHVHSKNINFMMVHEHNTFNILSVLNDDWRALKLSKYWSLRLKMDRFVITHFFPLLFRVANLSKLTSNQFCYMTFMENFQLSRWGLHAYLRVILQSAMFFNVKS